jgi:tripartite motif-containing protein 71
MQVFTEAGVFVRSFGKFGEGPAEFNSPWGVAIDRSSSNIVVSDTHNHRIQVFSEDGKFLMAFGEYGTARGQLCFPHGIAVSPNGDIIVADTFNHRICVFSSTSSSWEGGGKLLKSFTGTTHVNAAASSMPLHVTFSYPLGVAVCGTGDIVVSDWKSSRLEWLVRSDAVPKMSIGGSGRQAGQFDGPSALAFDDNDNILVCDYGNQRVQVCMSVNLPSQK